MIVRCRTYVWLTAAMCAGVHKGSVQWQTPASAAMWETHMPADGFVPGNRLLAALPPEVLQHLAPELETVPIHNKEVIQPIGRLAEHVYFPHSGMGSIVIHMKGGGERRGGHRR